ncbi:MAG: sugar phosphate isomerase/epimerase family protein [Thermoprotei archaeon]
MKVGFLSSALRNVPLSDLFAFGKSIGAQTVELAYAPYKESPRELARETGISISAIGAYANFLDPDEERRKANLNHVKGAIDFASNNDIDLVCTFVGRDPWKDVEENLALAQEQFGPVLDYAYSKNVKIAIENCPMEKFPSGTNIAYSPEIWDRLFKMFPSLGLELDPSHLVWQGIDYVKAAHDYAPKIMHVHAKDTELLTDRLSRVGIFGHGWWRYRIPGWGSINWRAFITALREGGYDGALDVEHEDPVYSGTEEKVKKGITLGVSYLSSLV